jgi:exopolysaccharide production protein ExoQ
MKILPTRTAATSRLDPPTVQVPWGLSLLLLAIFAFTSPFDPSYSWDPQALTIDEAMRTVEKGSVQRPIALCFLGLFALVSLLSRRRGRLHINGPLGWLVLFFLSLAIASPAWAEDPSLTVRRVGVLVLLSLGAVAVTARLSQIRTAALAVCVCSFTLIISLAAEIASGTFNPLDGTWRFSGVLYSICQGYNCGLLAIASLALAAVRPRGRNQLIVLALVGLLFLVLTRSRMPLASTILASAVCGSLVSRKVPKLAFVSAYLLVCASLLWVFLGGDLSRAAKSVATLGRGEEAASTLNTFTGRVEIWDEVFGYVKERPILGYGYDAFFNRRNLPAVSEATGWVPTSAHSGYIEALLGLGCLGAATFVLVLLLASRKSLSLARDGPSTAFAAPVMIWLCCNLFLDSSIITYPNFPTFICMVILASLSFKENTPSSSIRLPPRPMVQAWSTVRTRGRARIGAQSTV